MTSKENNNIVPISNYLHSLNDENIKNNLVDKNLQKCFNYIVSEAKKMDVNGVAVIENDVIFSWARHFFDEKMYESDLYKSSENLMKTVTIPKENKVVSGSVSFKKKVKLNDEKEFEEITLFDL